MQRAEGAAEGSRATHPLHCTHSNPLLRIVDLRPHHKSKKPGTPPSGTDVPRSPESPGAPA
jgi:hypothetical protein